MPSLKDKEAIEYLSMNIAANMFGLGYAATPSGLKGIKRLKEISGVQIFTTTHNTDLMSNDLLRPDCYFILKDNKIRAISDLTDKELRFAHNLQKMYKAGAFSGK